MRGAKKMVCYYIMNNRTGEENMIFGHYLDDAFRRHPELNRSEWTVTMYEYED